MTAARFNQLRLLARAATPGPWEVHDCGNRLSVDEQRRCGVTSVFESDARDECGHPVSVDDAMFIAVARTAVPELLDEVEQLRAALTKVRGATRLAQEAARSAEVDLKRGALSTAADCIAAVGWNARDGIGFIDAVLEEKP